MLPAGWVEARLGNALELKYGRPLPEHLRVPGGVPVYGSNGLVGSNVAALTNGPTVIVGRKGSAGRVHQSEIPCFPIDTTYYVDDFEVLDFSFSAHLLNGLGLEKLNRATAVPGLNREEAYALAINIPPQAEQRRIVAKLDMLTARLARARAELDRVPVLAKRLRDVALTAAFEGRLIEEADAPRESWIVVPFSEAGEIASNLVDPRDIGDLPHIAPNHISSGLPKLLPHRTIAEDGVISAKHHFYAGQIIYSKIRPYLRKVVQVAFDGGCSADMYPINARCHSRYLMYWMLSPQFTWLASQQEGRTVLPKINQNALNTIPTPLAPESVQAVIAESLDNIFARADRLEAEAARARALIDRLEAAILAKAFRGELVPQDPNDEPASVLLERIHAQRAAAPKAKRGRRAAAQDAT